MTIMNEKNNSTPLGSLVAGLRKAAGISTWTLAQRSGIDRSNIRRIESGVVSNITVATMQKLATALDIDVERFYEAHWETTGRTLPSLPTYFRTKYRQLSDHQIGQIEEFVAELQSSDKHTS
jgi:transcriptional regulator with XRE-family HTH domain